MCHRAFIATGAVLALVGTACAAPPPETIEVTRQVPYTVEVTRLVEPTGGEPSPEAVPVTRMVPYTVEVTRLMTQTVEVTRAVAQTVEVTRVVTQEVPVTQIVERLVTFTPPPATPRRDIAGARDLTVIPRPPNVTCVIVNSVLERRFCKLVYDCDVEDIAPSELADYYAEVMPDQGWALMESKETAGVWSLRYDVSQRAGYEMRQMIESGVVRVDPDACVTLYLHSQADVDVEDWEPFLEP